MTPISRSCQLNGGLIDLTGSLSLAHPKAYHRETLRSSIHLDSGTYFSTSHALLPRTLASCANAVSDGMTRSRFIQPRAAGSLVPTVPVAAGIPRISHPLERRFFTISADALRHWASAGSPRRSSQLGTVPPLVWAIDSHRLRMRLPPGRRSVFASAGAGTEVDRRRRGDAQHRWPFLATARTTAFTRSSRSSGISITAPLAKRIVPT